MSLASGIKSFAAGFSGGDRIDRENENRSLRNQQAVVMEEEAARTRNRDEMMGLRNLGNELGILKPGGFEIDPPKLEALLQKQRDSGTFDPRLEKFVTGVGNKDLFVENNEGFQFTNLQVGPDGTMTMQGTYAGDDTPKFPTTDRKAGSDSPVAFSSVEDVGGLLYNQYNQGWNRPGAVDNKSEFTDYMGLDASANTVEANNEKIRVMAVSAVGELTNEVERAIAATGGENKAEIALKLKNGLAQYKNDPLAQIEILQQVGSELKIPVAEIVTPEVQQAVEQKSFGVLRSDGDQPPTAKPDENPLVQSVMEKAAAATDEDIIEGKVQFSQEELDALQERLKVEGITSLQDANGKQRDLQQALRASIASLARDKETRRQYVQQLDNVIQTGNPAYDEKTLGEAVLAERTENRAQQAEDRQGYQAKTSRMTAETGRLNYFRQVEQQDWNVSEKVGERIRNNFTAAKKAIYGVDGDGNINSDINFDEGRFFSEYRGAFEDAYREFRSAPASTPRKAETQVALNSMISMGIQALAESEEYGSFGENFLPDGAINYIDGNDELLSRLQVQSDGSVIVYDPTTGSQQDESVPKSVLRKIFGDSGYAYFIKEIKGAKGSVKARANSNKAG